MENQPVKHGVARPGGRTEAVRKAVATAVLELLSKGNLAFTTSEVAEKAGIHRSTIYRRWPTREALIFEATTLHTAKISIPDTGSWEEDVYKLVNNLADFASDPVESAIIRAMIEPDNTSLSSRIRDYWQPMMEWYTQPVKRAISRGDIPADTDASLVFNMIISPLLLNALVTGETTSTDTRRQLAQMIINMTRKPA